jgi:hypothetical protein
MTPLKWWNLDIEKQYFIERNGQRYKYKCKLSGLLYGRNHLHDFGSSEYAWFIEKGFHNENNRDDKFYDAEKIEENAQKARQQMEHRALTMILKKVVNEQFEWL